MRSLLPSTCITGCRAFSSSPGGAIRPWLPPGRCQSALASATTVLPPRQAQGDPTAATHSCESGPRNPAESQLLPRPFARGIVARGREPFVGSRVSWLIAEPLAQLHRLGDDAILAFLFKKPLDGGWLQFRQTQGLDRPPTALTAKPKDETCATNVPSTARTKGERKALS
jgi:hypothetical protein